METKPPKIPTASTACVEHTVVHATEGDGNVSNYDAGACDETAICSTELLYSGEAEWY